MKKYSCPSCGAEVAFQSNLSVYAVCKYCNSMIVRRDVDVESIGKMATLPEDMSPLQIGTEGVYRGVRFGIVGRMKIGWEEGSWNEWFIISDDGRRGWLAEAQGFYAVSFELTEPLDLKTEKEIKELTNKNINKEAVSSESILEQGFSLINKFVGKLFSRPGLGSYVSIGKQELKVVDIKEATCIGSEGELPFSAPQGRKSTSIDFLGADGEFASVEIQEDKCRTYVGHYLDWDEMCCQNLRQLEGW